MPSLSAKPTFKTQQSLSKRSISNSTYKTALLASVVRAPAVGIRATHRAGEDGQLHLVGAGTDTRAILRAAPRLWAGLPCEALVLDSCTRKVRIVFERPEPYTVDGDMFEGPAVELAAAGPVTLLVPRAVARA